MNTVRSSMRCACPPRQGSRWRDALAWAGLALLLAACPGRMHLPVDVTPGELSPPYEVSFVNQTGVPFEVRPSRAGADAGTPNAIVPAGGTFTARLQLRRFTVGAGSAVQGVRVVDGPWFEQSPPDQAEIVFVQGDPQPVLIALGDASWFAAEGVAPRALLVPLRTFPVGPLFPRGPPGGP